MLLELRLFSLLDLLLNASQRLGCPRVGLGSVAQPGVDLVGVVWFHRSACVKLHDGQHNLNPSPLGEKPTFSFHSPEVVSTAENAPCFAQPNMR